MMPLCAILGDSLAAGVAASRPDCLSDTKVGISSSAYVAGHTMTVRADTALISLGVNDGRPTIATAKNLIRLRQGVTARTVYWILPARPDETRALIRMIARANGDWLIETRGFTGPDQLHPTAPAYRAIAQVFDLPPRR